MPSRTGYSLTPQQQEAIYGVIVECCGAPRDQQKTCLAYLASSGRDAEWRFEGWLGFGGKLYANSQGVYVDCYSEQKSPIVAFAIGIANTRIAEIIGGDYPTISATLGPCSRLAVEDAAAVVQEALDREMPHLHAAVGGEFAGARREASDEISPEATGEPPTPDEVERLARERDEALDLIEKAWNDGPTFKTVPLGDWLRERGRGPARAALDAARAATPDGGTDNA